MAFRLALVVIAAGAGLAAAARPAYADDEWLTEDLGKHALVGPVFGVTWGKGVKAHGTLGVEAGFALNILMHGNAGVTWRNHELFAYGELDAWYIVGGTLGMGYGTVSEWQPVVGIWEAYPFPIEEHGCDDWDVVVASAGYRWTGMHELYIAGKYGSTSGLCFD